jgi:hypothetical protein
VSEEDVASDSDDSDAEVEEDAGRVAEEGDRNLSGKNFVSLRCNR